MKKRNVPRGLMACAILLVAFILGIILHGAWVLRATPLQLAVGADDVDKVKSLVQQGADINEHSRFLDAWTPLIMAVFADRTNMVHCLLEAGADPNMAGRDGKTPLIWAAWGKHAVPLVKDLIAHGARLDAKDKDGATVFDYAQSAPPKPELLAALEEAKRKQEANSHTK